MSWADRHIWILALIAIAFLLATAFAGLGGAFAILRDMSEAIGDLRMELEENSRRLGVVEETVEEWWSP